MIYGLYHSAAGMMVNDYRQSVLANNLANAETVGFKRDIAIFAERVPASRAGRRDGPSSPDMQGLSGGLWLGHTATDYAEANVVQTDNPLDVALEGPGFLVVDAGGEPQLTRDGRMALTRHGQLVAASDGAPILGRGGSPIFLNPHGSRDRIAIDEDGRILQDDHVVGQLELVDPGDYGALRKVGAQRFAAPDNVGVRAMALVRGGFVETSGVEPLEELVGMLEASRAYQMNAQMITLQDGTLGRLIGATLRV